MTAPSRNFAMNVDDAARLMKWGRLAVGAGEEPEREGPDDALFTRIAEWRARHSEATP